MSLTTWLLLAITAGAAALILLTLVGERFHHEPEPRVPQHAKRTGEGDTRRITPGLPQARATVFPPDDGEDWRIPPYIRDR